MKNFTNRGFTLIEILVVVALIGIMAGIVVASLSSAKGDGEDVAIQATITKAQTQSELYYSNYNNYGGNTTAFTGLCPSSAVASTTAGMMGVAGSGLLLFTSDLVDRVGASNTVCSVSANGEAWAMAAKLKKDTTKVICVDGTGGLKISGITLSSAITNSRCN